MSMAVFWVVVPCSLVEVYRRFRGTCCLHHQGDEFTAQQPRRQLHKFIYGIFILMECSFSVGNSDMMDWRMVYEAVVTN
jgi:hypothetical protein